jgi:hypothetical protein
MGSLILSQILTVASPPFNSAFCDASNARDRPRSVSALHTERINSPLEAVRAAIVAEQRGQK